MSLAALLIGLSAGAASAARVVSVAPAQPPPEEVTLDQALEMLEQRAPRVAAERERIQQAQADVVAAGTVPNPTLSYGADQLVTGANTGAATAHAVSVEQPILLFGQRDTRLAAAERAVEAAGADVNADLAERRRAVRAAFAALLAGQERVRALEETLADLERVGAAVKARAAAGDRSRYDAARAEVEVQSVGAERDDALAAEADAAGRLAVLLGVPGWTPHAVGSLGEVRPPQRFDDLWRLARERNPRVVAAARRLDASRAELAAAEREAWPIPSISGGAVLTRDAASAQASVGLSVPLPVFDRNQGGVARAASGVREQTLASEAELAEARAELLRAHSVLAHRREALEGLRRVLDALPSLRSMAEVAYREGSSGILELLDAVRSRKELRLRWVDGAEALQGAEADLIAAAGLDGQR